MSTKIIKSVKKRILIADDDPIVLSTISHFFVKMGYEVSTVSNGEAAYDEYFSFTPDAIIADVQMPLLSGVDFLKKLRGVDTVVPVIMATGFPEMSIAIETLKSGAYDYLVKPFQMETLYTTVENAIANSRLKKENKALSELASLHSVSSIMAKEHELDKITKLTSSFCMDVLGSDKCTIYVDMKGGQNFDVISAEAIDNFSEYMVDNESEISEKVLENISDIKESRIYESEDIKLLADADVDSKRCIMAAPVFSEDRLICVIKLDTYRNGRTFSDVDLNALDVLAGQVGSAINNSRLYTSLNQRLSELSLLSNYSEKFLGILDIEDVIIRLFETVIKNIDINFIGFLYLKKRFHDFIYWSDRKVDKSVVKSIISVTVDEYNRHTDSKSNISLKRVKHKNTRIEYPTDDILEKEPEFIKVIPLIWDKYNFGALCFGMEKKPIDENDIISIINSLLNQTRIALTNAKLYSQMKENYIRTIKALAIAVDAKDTYTHGHSENVMNIAEMIAREMNLDEDLVGVIRDGGLLHDIGKIGIPGNILNKPGPLTEDEYNGVMKTHSTLGANIVKDVPFLKELYTLILHHHEHFDGNGYPDGLKGDEIPIGARILHVADAFEAMTSNRPYRNSLGKKEAVKRLMAAKGTQFDPAVIDAFFKMAEKRGWFTDDEEII